MNVMGLGVYLHIPFCEHKCGYCDFYSASNINQYGEDFTKALLKEINAFKQENIDVVDTVFLGGGTPTLLSVLDLEKILNSLNEVFQIKNDVEITIEANPETVSYEYLKNLYSIGINRISFGVQSFNENELRFMERIHTARKAIDEISNARRAGFENISCDLIFGLPNQTIKDWSFNLEQAVSLGTDHISAYSLIYEQNTRFGQLVKKGEIRPISQDFDRTLYEYTIQYLEENQFMQYEVSNYSKGKEKQSLHNLKYWKMKPYIGFGPSAHSFDGNYIRSWNIRSTEKYIEKLNAGESPMINSENISPESHMFEWIMLGFRLREGVSLLDFNLKFNVDFREYFRQSINKYCMQGLMELSDTHCRLTDEGLFYSDYISANF